MRRLALAAAALAATCLVYAHVRLAHPSSGSPLYWGGPDAIPIVISSAGSDDLDDESHETALRNAIDAWNRAAGSEARIVEDPSPYQQGRTDWQSDGLHLVYFDEDDSSGYFPMGSGIVAVTPVYFFSSGRIADADVLFNGKGFHFTTSREPARFDIQDVGAHELGHFLGLDHSGWAGATMYPSVDPSILLHRSLSLDDERGLRDAYPDAQFASIYGKVGRISDSTAVSGAHVVARDAIGRPVAATLSRSDGRFELVGLDGGSHELYAAPLEGPVTAFNLTGELAIDVDFGVTTLGTFTVEPGEALDAGSFLLAEDHAVSAGRVADDYPLRALRGQTRRLQVRGYGFDEQCELAASDPSIVITNVAWSPTSVEFDVAPPPDAPFGHVDVEVVAATGERAVVTAALEITPPDPSVSLVVPDSADSAGGSSITIAGEHFRSGARVVIGDRVYEEGVAGGATLVDEGTLALTLGETIGGRHDVVVIDATGVEGRLLDGFLVVAQPVVGTIFPAVGSAAGGTLVTITGEGFAPGATISIAGVPQSSVSVENPERILFTTEAFRAGGPYELTVTNPGGKVSTSSFTFVAVPDPTVTLVDPASGSVSGGETVFVRGANFAPGTEVVFGAEAATGEGGVLAGSVVFVDASTLQVLTPSMGSGAKSVLVRDPWTDQASVLTNAFTYTGSSSDGGGSCLGVVASRRFPPGRILAASGWIFVVLALAFARLGRVEGRALAR